MKPYHQTDNYLTKRAEPKLKTSKTTDSSMSELLTELPSELTDKFD